MLTATWFCAQCLARLGQRVGISLLELNTLGHALCALLIYCLWWNKPLDTKEPEQILIREEKELQLVAVLCATSKLDDFSCELDRWTPSPLTKMLRALISHGSDEKPPKPYHLFGRSSYAAVQFDDEHPPPEPTWGGIMDVLKENWDSHFMLFPVVSSGPGTKRWIVGLGNATASRKLSDDKSELLRSKGFNFTS
jgi:hypothetical protein